MFDPTESEEYYEVETESPEVLREMLSENMVQPKAILSTVGGYPWPVFFSEEFPNAKILGFDNNPRQIAEFTETIKDTTGNTPYLLDITHTNRLENVLIKNNIDLTFLSNIPDYLEPDESEEIAEILIENEVSWILLSHMTNGDRSKGYQYQGCRSLLEVLKDEGYKIKRITDNSYRYDISEYYLAISPKKAKLTLIEQLRREQVKHLVTSFSPA